MGRGKGKESKKSQRKGGKQSIEPESANPGPSTPPPREPASEDVSAFEETPRKRRLPVATTPTPHSTGDIRKDDDDAAKVLALTRIRHKLPQEVSQQVEEVIGGNRHGKHSIFELSKLNIGTAISPAKQRMIERKRQEAEAIIEDMLQMKETSLAQSEKLVEILNKAWSHGKLDLRTDEYDSQIKQLERLIIALRGDVVVIRTSRHELSGRIMDDMIWQQDRQNTDWAYLDLLISRYKTPEGAKLSLFASRDPSAQERFRKKVMKAYDAVDQDMQWCVISGKYFPASTVKAAHIVGYNVGEPSAHHLFGPPDNKDGHLMSEKNGIPMYDMYEKAFDDARLVIVPHGDPQNGCWKVWCLDDPDTHKPSKAVPVGRELHGRSLQFLNDFRPSTRYLYFSFCINILRRQRHQVPGWWRNPKIKGPGKAWATPGTYLRTSTLRRLAHRIGHLTEDEAAVFAPGPVDEDEDVEMANTQAEAINMNTNYREQNSPTPATYRGKRLTGRDESGEEEEE